MCVEWKDNNIKKKIESDNFLILRDTCGNNLITFIIIQVNDKDYNNNHIVYTENGKITSLKIA